MRRVNNKQIRDLNVIKTILHIKSMAMALKMPPIDTNSKQLYFLKNFIT